MTKLILLNAPPRAGKDTCAEIICDSYLSVHMKFADILHLYGQIFIAELTADDEYAIEHYSTEAKEEPLPGIYFSYRQHLMALSEEFFKPRYGNDIFGVILAAKVQDVVDFDETVESETVIVVSDSGFREEAIPVINTIGAENVLLIQILRDNCNYSGDSRSWINLNDLDIKTITIENDGTLIELQEQLLQKISAWMESRPVVQPDSPQSQPE